MGVALPGECGLLRVDGTVGTQGGHRGGQPVVVDVRSLRRNTAVEQHLEVLEGVASRLGVLWEGRQLFADSVEFHESDEGVGERVEPGLSSEPCMVRSSERSFEVSRCWRTLLADRASAWASSSLRNNRSRPYSLAQNHSLLFTIPP